MADSSKAGDEYPSHVSAPSLVIVKLSGRDTYDVWKTQMRCLLKSHDMLGFISRDEHAQGKKGEYWRRSDELVKAWILGSLSQETLKHVVNPDTDLSTAQQIWEELQTIYGPNPLLAERRKTLLAYMRINEGDKKAKKVAEQLLYKATIAHQFPSVERILNEKVVTLRDKITVIGDTALHVAVATTKKKSEWEFLQNMLNLATQDNPLLLDVRNSQGSSLLHVAAITGHTEAAKMLVEKNEYLLSAKDNEGQTPVARALSNRHTDTYEYLKDCCIKYRDIEIGDMGLSELLVNIISSKDYESAYSLLAQIKKLPTETDTVLVAVAHNFPPTPNFWERIVSTVPKMPKFKFVESWKRKAKANLHAVLLLNLICYYSVRNAKAELGFFNNAVLEATRQNAEGFLRTIMGYFPNLIWSVNEDAHNIIQYAVINRSQKVYILLYRMIENKNFFRTLNDPLGNNLLHLAARLAPPEKLSHISGAALQIQFELQWFEGIEGFISPLCIIQKNRFGETPQMVFTREHKELVTEGEKWMKDAAESYTITAALITTIVFAAAITVPGGNKQDGIPMFSNKAAFTIFAVSDAVSLFASVTSLLMFLAILTARFSEQDFLLKLPRKLIIGLVTLFISTTAMLVAFGATLFLVFGHNNALILVPIAVLTCLPITTFMTLQFHLIYDLIRSTYFRSIFAKKSDRPLHYFFDAYPIY